MICVNPNSIEFKQILAEVGDPLYAEVEYAKRYGAEQIKPGVSELFESNPELAEIGTPEQYSNYLDTIFPDSKVKDIVYHVGSRPSIERFDKKYIGSGEGTAALGKGFYFGNNLIEQAIQVGYEEAARESVQFNEPLDAPYLSALLNIKNPYYEEGTIRYKLSGKSEKIIENEDGIIDNQAEYVVFEPEQIHILGGKQDIQGFKEFVSKNINQRFAEQAPTQFDRDRLKAINELNDMVRNFRVDEILAEKGYDVQDFISNLETANNQDELNKIINKILQLLC